MAETKVIAWKKLSDTILQCTYSNWYFKNKCKTLVTGGLGNLHGFLEIPVTFQSFEMLLYSEDLVLIMLIFY
jgi:hypothetical protein